MSEITAKETILKKVRQALLEKTKNPFPEVELDTPFYADFDTDLAVEFAENYTQAKGHFVYNSHHFEAMDNFITLMENKRWTKVICKDETLTQKLIDSGIEYEKKHKPGDFFDCYIIPNECLVSKTGSIVISDRICNLQMTDLTNTLVVFAKIDDIVKEMKDANLKLKNKYGNNQPRFIKWLTGPSIERGIQMLELPGIRGPIEIYLFLIDNK